MIIALLPSYLKKPVFNHLGTNSNISIMSEPASTTSKEKLPQMSNATEYPTIEGEYPMSESEVIQEVIVIPDRPYSLFSLLSMGYSISNTAMTMTGSLSTGLANGGPIIFVWAQIMIFVMSLCIACSLGELASAFPHAGGQYYWAAQLAPPRIRRFMSYLLGIVSWAGVVVNCASGSLAIPQMAIGMILLRNPNMTFHPWMLFLGYQLTNICLFFFNLFERLLPKFSMLGLIWSVFSLVIIFIAVLAAAPTHQSADFVFTDFVNLSGWNSQGITYLTGMLGANWGFSCLDAVTHMAEEIPNPRTNIPKALLSTVIMGIATSWPYAIALMFCVQDMDAIITTPTGVPSLELFNQVLQGNTAGAVGLQSLVLIVFFLAMVGAQTWQSRIAWSFARNQAWPFSNHLARVAPAPFDVPIWAHLWSCCWVAVLGCLYLGSTIAFNSFVSGAILLQYLSYSMCVILLLIHGREKIKHGPFWLGKWGYVTNIVTVAWTLLCLIFYSFPPSHPSDARTTNYVSAVIAVIFIYAVMWWLLVGRRNFVVPAKLE